MDFIHKDGMHDGVGALFIKDIEKLIDKKLTFVATKSWSETLQK